MDLKFERYTAMEIGGQRAMEYSCGMDWQRILLNNSRFQLIAENFL